MEEKLKGISKRISEIESEMSNPEILSDQKRFMLLNKEHSKLAPIVHKYEKLSKMRKEHGEAKELLKHETDHEMKELLKSEIEELTGKIEELEEKLMIMILPEDPNAGKNVIMEIRAGTGGDEAALFVADLYRMYSRYIDIQKWKMEIIDINHTEIGGYKEIILYLSGEGVYESLKFESGVHRVQRIPTTESSGRIHTSAVTVAVLAEADESEVEINPDELRIDVYRSSGHGGQSVNTTDSAVRITHLPTGMVVTCQDEKSQHKNKAKALKVLRARLYEKIEEEKMAAESKLRKSQVGSGDRSERIRTYNFPQSRVTDHRIGLTLYSLEDILDGNLDDIIEPLKKYEVEQLLKTQGI